MRLTLTLPTPPPPGPLPDGPAVRVLSAVAGRAFGLLNAAVRLVPWTCEPDPTTPPSPPDAAEIIDLRDAIDLRGHVG